MQAAHVFVDGYGLEVTSHPGAVLAYTNRSRGRATDDSSEKQAMAIDLLTPPYNFAICKMHERAFPGIVVQGDTFYALFRLLERVSAARSILPNDDPKALELDQDFDQLEYECNKFKGVLKGYEEVCARHGYGLPYVKPTA